MPFLNRDAMKRTKGKPKVSIQACHGLLGLAKVESSNASVLFDGVVFHSIQIQTRKSCQSQLSAFTFKPPGDTISVDLERRSFGDAGCKKRTTSLIHKQMALK